MGGGGGWYDLVRLGSLGVLDVLCKVACIIIPLLRRGRGKLDVSLSLDLFQASWCNSPTILSCTRSF
jgi:hypothetical protein